MIYNMDEETKLVPIADADKDNGGRLLPEVRDKVIKAIEDHLNETKKINVSEISRNLGVAWVTAELLVKEVTERWRQEDAHKIQQYRRSLVESSGTFIMGAEKEASQGNLSFDKMEKIIDMFAKLIAVTKIENQPVANLDDASKVVAVHFNNLNMTPSMAKEIERVRESNGDTTSQRNPGSESQVV
jgi:hypothetical protein